MNTVSISQKNDRMTLDKALLVYSKASPYSSQKSMAMVTEHSIAIVNGQSIVKEGTLLSEKSLREMAKAILNKKDSQLTVLPENILAQSDDTLVWWIPAGVRRMTFRTAIKGLENISASVPVPATIFAVTGDSAYAICMTENQRPNAKTPLFYSPYFNVWDAHNICMGSTRKAKSGDVIAWTDNFFASAFSHSNYRSPAATLKRRGDRAKLWQDLVDGTIKRFPTKSLPSAKLNLQQFLDEISK